MKITLKANEKIYVNGAVIRADRKVALEFLNDVHFLLENHVLQAEDADTPLRQLYFVVQIMLINPDGAEAAREMFGRSLPLLLSCFCDRHMLASLKRIDQMVREDQLYEALKAIRALYDLEASIMNKTPSDLHETGLARALGA